MKRIGTVLVFKPGVSTAEAAMGLNQIRHLLDLPETTMQPKPSVKARLERGETVRFDISEWEEAPFRIATMIHEWDDEETGTGPVWYIP